MIHASFEEMVTALAKPGQDILHDMDADKAHAMHMAIGVSGEAGELLDAIKKHVVYNKVLDRQNIVEELGDIEFYLEGLRQGLDISRAEIVDHNINKLSKRYGATYSNKAAQQRADKANEQE